MQRKFVARKCYAPFNAYKPPKTVAPIDFMLKYILTEINLS